MSDLFEIMLVYASGRSQHNFMSDINGKRKEINSFAKDILSYVENKPELIRKFRCIYKNVIKDINSCIKEDEYVLDHPLKVRYAIKMNEMNYDALCDVACDLIKYAEAKLPEKIHKRIMLGKTSTSVKKYASLV